MGFTDRVKQGFQAVQRLGQKAVSSVSRVGKKVDNAIREKFTGGANVSQMDAEEKRAAWMSNEAYSHPDNRAEQFEGYNYDRSLSDKRTAVYHNPSSKKSHISYRGTADASDLPADHMIMKGTQQQHGHFKDALHKHDQVKKKYQSKIELSGHSLGGSKAEYVSQKRNVKAHTFNQGTGLSSVKDNLRCRGAKKAGWCDKITRHTTKGDIISMLNPFSYGKTKHYKTEGLKSHFISNYLPNA